MDDTYQHYPLALNQDDCKIPHLTLEGLATWLGDRPCVSIYFPLLSVFSAILPILLIADDPDNSADDCSSLLLAASDTWRLTPLLTPSTQRIFVVDGVSWSVKYASLKNRQAVIGFCNNNFFYVKTAFEAHMKKILDRNLLQALPGEEISKERAVILGTFNCSIYSAFGPLDKGKPQWIDGVEMLGVASVLESLGLTWTILPADGFGMVYPDGTLEEGKLKWLIKGGHADIGFCAFWQNTAMIADVINPWQRSCTRLLVPRPGNANPPWHAIFHPLPEMFWLFLLLSEIVTVGILSLFNISRMKIECLTRVTIRQCSFQAMTFAVHGMGNNNLRLNRESRIVQTAWAYFILIASAAYSSSLASILTTPVEDEAPHTLIQLLEKGYVWVSGLGPLINPEFVYKTQSGVDHIWMKFEVNNPEILKGKTAVLGEELSGLFIMPRAHEFSEGFLNTLMVSQECLAANHISILTRKMSPYYEFLSAGFSRLAESGVLNKMLSDGFQSPHIAKYIVKNAFKNDFASTCGMYLSLHPLRGTFYILIGGHLLAVLAFLYEVRHPPNKHENSRKT